MVSKEGVDYMEGSSYRRIDTDKTRVAQIGQGSNRVRSIPTKTKDGASPCRRSKSTEKENVCRICISGTEQVICRVRWAWDGWGRNGGRVWLMSTAQAYEW